MGEASQPAELLDRLSRAFPRLRGMNQHSLDELLSRSTVARFARGDVILQPGDVCAGSPLVLDGELRVHSESETGRALTLYNVVPGQMCSLTSLSLTSGRPFPAYVEATQDTVALLVPPSEFTRLLGIEDRWRAYAFGQAWERMDDLLGLIDTVLFTDLPTRLAQTLLTAQDGGVVTLTHERIAADIGSAREAVSRVLKRWEAAGLIALTRGRIIVLDSEALTRIAGR